VLAPAHYQVPFSRLGPYRRAQLDDPVYRGGEFTEQWAHEASIVPMETLWPLRPACGRGADRSRAAVQPIPHCVLAAAPGNSAYAGETAAAHRPRADADGRDVHFAIAKLLGLHVSYL